MSKTKLIWVNLIIWPVAVFLIFFNNYAVSNYYWLKNGDSFQLNNIEYTVSRPAFIIGTTDSGNVGLGYIQSNELAMLYLENGSLAEVEKLESIFNSNLKIVKESHCKFLFNSTNPNLPYLSWVNSKFEVYFILTDKPGFDIDLAELCNIVS
ncbi:hypothetical protein [Shewanella pneumatophori]|uniref:Uncharacterized protein n=1 Tax=Shewanella pneumatophori TaxID=314092 RepID=A0A9X1Z8W3_9GAMM|nr:hypothetical protein [Shewanella pneumatophori]MCL1137724.1 hypothetical protein [Shewanella pneumatophori]